MKRKIVINTLLVLIIALAAVTVLAGFFPSFGGSNNNTITYIVYLKGNAENVTISLSGNLTPVCRNNGGNEVPGQRNVMLTTYSGDPVVLPSTKGLKSYTFHLDGYPLPDGTGGELDMPSWNQAGCPNSTWNVSRVSGTLFGTISATTNGRTELFGTSCQYNSAIKGPMECSIYEL